MQGFSTGGPWPPGGPRRHCRGSATLAHVDQFTIEFFYFYKFAMIFQHISRLLLNIVKISSYRQNICAGGGGVVAASDVP